MAHSNISQIPLDLGHREAFGREDFLVAPSNAEAVAWIDRWPDWQSHILVLYGPSASGKSHLSAVWAQKTGASFWTAEDIISEKTLSDKQSLVIDRADLLIGDIEAETKLFHLYNMAKEQQSSLLMTMAVPPSQLSFCIPDLSSRLRSSQAIGIETPDDALLSAVIVKLFSDRQITISPEVLKYILPRMDRSFDAAKRLVEDADKLALSQKKPISIPIMRQVLGNV
ncbi:MAG: HdaA/DnaA family protein [Bdellovibrionales bacterium]